MHRLKPSQYDRARPIFQAMHYNLAVQAILDGSVPADIYVDDLAQPQVTFTSNGQRHYLAGLPQNHEFNDFLRRRLVHQSSHQQDSGDDPQVPGLHGDSWFVSKISRREGTDDYNRSPFL